MAKNDDLPYYFCLKLKTPEQTPEGFLIVAQNDMFPFGSGRFPVVGLRIFSFAVFFLIILIFFREPLFDFFNLFKLIFKGELALSDLIEYLIEGLLGLVPILFFLFGFIWIFIATRWLSNWSEQIGKFERPGELILSKYPLKLGESCQIRYRRLLKTGITLPETGHLKARLLCSEVVTYRVGTDDTTVRKIMFEKSLAEQTLDRGTRSIEFEETLEIPSNSTPSFQAENNRILWEIEVKLDLPGLISPEKNPLSAFMSPDLSTFAFVVDPEVVRS